MTSLDDIVENFSVLGDWEQRYLYLTELGKKLPAMPDDLRVDDNRVKPCMSKVWITAYRDEDDPRRIRFHGDCDTGTIKGVLAVLIELASGQRAAEIEKLDVDEVFERLHLYEHLSPNRHVGVYAIVELMKEQVRALEQEAA